MYRIIAKLILVAGITGGSSSAMAATPAAWEFKVNDKVISTSTTSPYRTEENVVMVPLRITSEQLGYRVHWNAKQQYISLDAPYQIISLKENARDIHVANDFQAIPLAGDFTLDSEVVKKQGVTYVPATFFERLFNTVEIGQQSVTIAVSVAYTTDTNIPTNSSADNNSISVIE